MDCRIMAAIAVVVSLIAAAPSARGDEVRYYQQDGVVYRETRRVVLHPVCETKYRQTTQTVYREERNCEFRDTVRTWWSPKTEYRCEARWEGTWNPFTDPCLVYRMVPQTCWEARTEVVQVPVTSCRMVPETRTVEVPVTTRRMVAEEVISRVAVGGNHSAARPILSSSPTPVEPIEIGGLARLDKDPPRQGVNPAWRQSVSPR
jgi:hypothetical protein